jgi:hypothetical protein
MKSFSRFLTEAAQSQASMQAKKLGLKGDGHGGWLDRSGKTVARTVKGKLKYIDGRQAAAPGEPSAEPQRAAAAPAPAPAATPQQAPAPTPPAAAAPAPEDQEQETGDTLTVVFGRFNPPTVGHEKLLKSAEKASTGGDLKIYPSRSQDPKKNPLDPDTKISYMRKMFPKYGERIINDYKMKTIFDVLVAASEEGYANVNIIVGSDRQAEFENLAQKYNGDLYTFDLIRVISAGVRDADAEGVEGMSASKMRKAVIDDDFNSFRRGTPKSLDDSDTQALFNAVRQGMGVKKSKVKKESYNLWEIAPKCDMKNLRENYVRNKIFKMGDKVQNLNTGLIGEVMRRGTNHLICVSEEGYMFKSWIKDLMEYTEVKMDSPMRDKIHPNTLVGTLGAFKHYSKMTPGAIGTGKENLQYGGKAYGVNFINKYRKIKESIYSNGY